MNIQENVSLTSYSTMRLGGSARYLIEIDSQDLLKESLAWSKDQNLEVIMIGTGSNIVWRDEGFDGLILVNKILGFEVSDLGNDISRISIGAGENWDEVVGRCCDLGLSGIESLSLIPGSAGATPIQNVGAYGQEISSVLENIIAYDSHSGEFITINNANCGFSYRSSQFKEKPGRFFITKINLKLSKTSLAPPFYASLESYLTDKNITDYSPSSIRKAVIEIRRAKLPDPAVVNNCGSFFANPIISNIQFEQLKLQIGVDIPHWPTKTGDQKLPAAWLLENVGYKDFHDPISGIGTWPTQSLVLVNESASSTNDLLHFADEIIDKVNTKFGITLEQEPQLLP